MKELSIEEKAKAYDEAKARMSKAYNSNRCTIGFMNEIFPELRESGDEKIVDAIRKALESKIEDLGNGITKTACLAWLEKQEGCEHIKKEWLEHIKQSWYKEGFIDGKYSGGTSKEWTINDTTTLNELIDFLENGTAKLQHDLTRYANWLKIQFTPIEKQEWSEEDEVKINRIVACLENLNVADNDILLKDVDWLKSLRPQSQWKPSDEQIGVIEAVINNRSFQRRHLVSLHEQLKKLREE